MTYPEALSFLARVRGMWMKLGLERIEQLAAALGNPEKRLRFIHVAGTNGKGSTCAFTASILQAAGFRVGMLTSPHLVSPRERIQINDKLISREALAEGAGVIAQFMDEGKADPGTTFFELITGLALWHFDREQVDYVVWETGLGGRLDATNFVTPQVCVIPTIGFDHMHKLGNTLAAIAGEKAGILKPGVPLITAVEQPEALDVLQARAHELNCPVIRIGTDWPAQDLGIKEGKQQARLNGTEYALNLLGAHQVQNAACAVAAVEQLNLPQLCASAPHRFPERNDRLKSDHEVQGPWLHSCGALPYFESNAQIRLRPGPSTSLRSARGNSMGINPIVQGLAQASWPGRFQRLQEDPPLILEGAHNLEGVRAALQTWRASYGDQKYHLGFGVVADKPVEEMIRTLAAQATGVTLLPLQSARAAAPEELRHYFGRLPVTIAPSVTEGWRALQQKARREPVLIAGSLFLAGEILACAQGRMDEWMENEWMEPAPRHTLKLNTQPSHP